MSIKNKTGTHFYQQTLSYGYSQNLNKKTCLHTQRGSVLTELVYHESLCWLFEVMSTAVRSERGKGERRRTQGSLTPLISLLNAAQFKGTLLVWLSKINNTAGGVYNTISLLLRLYASLLRFPQHHCRLPLCLPSRLHFMSLAFAISSLFPHLPALICPIWYRMAEVAQLYLQAQH